MRRRPALLPLLALVAPAMAPAQAPGRDPHAVQPERPTVATHAFTVAPGWAEIEAGIEIDRYADRSTGASAPVVVKIGLASRLQLDLDGSLLRLPGRSTTGIGDLAVGAKWHLLEGASALGDFAVLAALKLPTAPTASRLGTGTTDASLVLISSHAFGPVSLDINGGYTWRSGPGTLAPRSASLWTVSLGADLDGGFGWTAEIYGYPGTSGPSGAAPIVAVLTGPTLLVRPWLALDAGVIVPVSGPQPRALYAGGVTNLGRL